MVFQAVIGHSNDPDSGSAAMAIIQHCQDQLQDCQPQAGILFAAPGFDYLMLLARITEAFPQVQLIGGSTDAEISSEMGFQEDSCALVLFHSDVIEMQVGIGHGLSKDSQAATSAAVATAMSGLQQPAKLCMTFADGLTQDTNQVVFGLQQALGKMFPILGGITGDQMEFQRTWQFCHTPQLSRAVLSDAVVVLLFAGPLQYAHSMGQGWTPLSQTGQLTEIDATTFVTINDQPAADFYYPYLNGAEPSIEYPLAIFEPGATQFYLRAPVETDVKTGRIKCLAGFAPNSTVQIAHTNREELITATRDGFAAALAAYPGAEPSVAFLLSCCTRRLLLGTQTGQEFAQIQSLAPHLPMIGFYTYGEICPLSHGNATYLHHETFVTILLGEA